MRGTVFDDRIADGITALNAVTDVLGPGRLSRCVRAAIRMQWGSTTTQGVFEVQFSHHQDFPGVPEVIGIVPWSAAGQTHAIHLDSKYLSGFVRGVLTTASDGNGVSAWASGSR